MLLGSQNHNIYTTIFAGSHHRGCSLISTVATVLTYAGEEGAECAVGSDVQAVQHRAGFKCVEAMGRIIIRGPYPPSSAIIYMHVQL